MGMAKFQKKKYEDGIPFYPHFVLKDLTIILIYLVIFFFIIFFIPNLFFPKDAFEPADPFVTPAHIKPEWYFLASYQILKIFPSELMGIAANTLIVLFLFFLPFIDRSEKRHPLDRPIFTTLVILGLLAFIGLSIWGHYS